MEETWKTIEGYDEYEVSSHGNVRRGGRVKKSSNDINEYDYNRLRVSLYKKNIQHTFSISRLVAAAFLPNPDNLPTVDHINRDPTDNRVENLRWASRHMQAMNRTMMLSSSGNRHVYRANSRYIVKIRRNNIFLLNKSFGTFEEAIKARDEWLDANR